MHSMNKTELVGFVELKVGSMAVQVPIRQAEPEAPEPTEPSASFETDGKAYAIFIRGKASSQEMEKAVGEAAKEALTHLSRKLLN